MIRKLTCMLLFLAGCALAQNRVYELRTYHCNEGKLEAVKARFRDHALAIFARLGMETVGFWVPQDPETSKNTLIYILVHPSREIADKHWAEFQADPEWKRVRAESEANGPLLQKVDRVFMDPIDFSKLK